MPLKRKNPFKNDDANEPETETNDADKNLFLIVFNICKSLKKDTIITTETAMSDITADNIQYIIDDFENSNELTRTKLNKVVNLTNSFKNIETVEKKIKICKKYLRSVVASSLWEIGITKTNFNKEKFINFLKSEKEKKEIEKAKKDIVMK